MTLSDTCYALRYIIYELQTSTNHTIGIYGLILSGLSEDRITKIQTKIRGKSMLYAHINCMQKLILELFKFMLIDIKFIEANDINKLHALNQFLNAFGKFRMKQEMFDLWSKMINDVDNLLFPKPTTISLNIVLKHIRYYGMFVKKLKKAVILFEENVPLIKSCLKQIQMNNISLDVYSYSHLFRVIGENRNCKDLLIEYSMKYLFENNIEFGVIYRIILAYMFHGLRFNCIQWYTIAQRLNEKTTIIPQYLI